jgi:hypothetical protein
MEAESASVNQRLTLHYMNSGRLPLAFFTWAMLITA